MADILEVIIRAKDETSQSFQQIAKLAKDTEGRMRAIGQLETEFGSDNLAVLALYAASAAASAAGLEAVERAEGAVGRRSAGGSLQARPGADRGSAAVAAPARGNLDQTIRRQTR